MDIVQYHIVVNGIPDVLIGDGDDIVGKCLFLVGQLEVSLSLRNAICNKGLGLQK